MTRRAMNDMDTDRIQIISLELNPPSLADNTADGDRLTDALKPILKTDRIQLDLEWLKILPYQLRDWNYQVRCAVFPDRDRWHLIGITSQTDPQPMAGLAVDLGTTRVVLRLIDLASGKTLAESAFNNPQIAIGPDVLARIHFADGNPDGLNHLQHLIIGGLNRNIEQICHHAGISPDHVLLMAVAGNTTMTHLFLGLPPRWIIREPYIPVVNKPGLIRARDLGIQVGPSARVMVFPNVGSYFGGDLIAGILYSGLWESEDTAILVDVGTNAEVVLGNRDWMMACAGAAGPALEGGVTRMGMMAGPGVIDRVTIDPETLDFHIHTIDDKPPIGICGSGLIDLAAHMAKTGIIDIRGKLTPSDLNGRIKDLDGIRHLVVVPAHASATGEDLTISQADLDSLIRSKAAMYTILETITSTVGMEFSHLSRFYVAGTFGSFIDPQSAITIGMVPDLPLDHYQSLGNSSLKGATKALTMPNCMEMLDTIRDRITYLELNVNQDFMNRFSAAKFIPHTDVSRFPSVTLRSLRR